MTIRNFFAVGSSFTGKVIIQDDEGKGYVTYYSYPDIEENLLDAYIVDWEILFEAKTILITASVQGGLIWV